MYKEQTCVRWLEHWRQLLRRPGADAGGEWPPAAWYTGWQPGDLAWQDPVTGTCYVLNEAEARRITQTALAFLRQGAGVTGEQLYRYVQDPEEFLAGTEIPLEWEEAVRLLPELPAAPADLLAPGHGSQWPRPARLADRAMLHAGLLWALDLPGVRQAWPRLRLRCLMETLALHAPGAAGTWPVEAPPVEAGYQAAARAAAAAAGLPLDAAAAEELHRVCEGFRVGLVKAHTIKVKGYYLQNNKIPAIRGASLLLESINLERYPRYFATSPDLLTPEGLVYTGGAGALAVVPAGAAAAAAREWERLHERVTLVARSVAVHMVVDLARFALDFRRVNGALEALLRQRRGAKLQWWLHPTLAEADVTLHAGEGGRTEAAGWPEARGGRVCRHCGLRRAKVRAPVAGGPEELCAACAIKWEAGRRARRGHFAPLYQRWAPTAAAGPEAPQTLADLAAQHGDGHSIAVVYGDGNNMGQVLQKVQTAGELRQFSQRVQKAVYRAVFPALEQHLGSRAVEFIALGGDDLFFIMPADAALTTAATLVREFDRAFYNLTEGRATMTMSVGIAVAGANTPVAYLFDVAQRLLKSAKGRAREVQERDPRQAMGTVDMARVDGIGSPPGLGLRPFTWAEAAAVAELIRVLKAPGSLLGTSSLWALRELVASGDPQEAELYYHYQLSRRLDRGAGQRWFREFQAALSALLEQTGAAVAADSPWAVPGPFWTLPGGRRATPWVDVVELWDCAAQRSQHRRGVTADA